MTTPALSSTKAQTTAPASSSKVTTTSQSTSAPKATTTAKTTQATTTATTTVTKKSGHQKEISDEWVKLVNQYRKANGLSVSTSTGGWQNHADRFTKFFVEQGSPVEIHGLGIYEVFAMNGGVSKNIAQSILTQWKNSEGHNEALLQTELGYAKYIYSSVYYCERTGYYIAIVGLMNRTYEEHYSTYGKVLYDESWYENGGTSDFAEEYLNKRYDKNGNPIFSEADDKKTFLAKGYQKYYPHLK